MSEVIFYGKDGELTGADREDQETSMLALHLLQSALVHLNTLLVQVSLSPPGPAASPTTTAADSRRCSGRTSTPTARSTST
jgi:TnpA family transposase